MSEILTDTQSRSISTLSHDVKSSLSNLKLGLERQTDIDQFPIQPNVLEDLLDRFLLWAGNLGALQDSTSTLSLDSRISSSPEIYEQVCEFLDDLREAINDLTEIFEGNRPNRDLQNPVTEYLDICHDYELENPPPLGLPCSDEAHAIVEVILQCIRSLFRIGVLIRKSSPRDRFQQALQDTDCVFPTVFDIDHVRHKYPKLSESNTQTITGRMGKANAKRRQFIKYCRDHKSRLEAEDERAEKQSSKATTLPPTGLDQLTQLERYTAEDEDRISLTTASTTFESAEDCRLPTLGELSPDFEPFECPICFTLQSFRREKAWRFHAFCDLRAYACTVGGPECEEKLFMTRNSWFEHELKVHRSKFACPICKKDSDSKVTMMSHIGSAHINFTAEQIPILAEEGRVVPTRFDARECPFCNDWAVKLRSKRQALEGTQFTTQDESKLVVSMSRFRKHVATHQEQLATFVVSTPREPGDTISESEDDDELVREVDKLTIMDNAPNTIRFRTSAGGGSVGYSGWRWDCCSCSNGANQSYIYNPNCVECWHRRADCCEVYRIKITS
ncbi:uncharacterized protein F4807DRAFT_448958 [Annulohypoxylon truncatum]|uniref:uncharacterized protein n=1 Tax=Annulohypoxylon truncatum TaxID=327061 RepID=UPI00200808C1|nr:uncharacterized protein F4807DRAFT_448958 [Annulohypoxylon truncatum]KAI1204105.1 hypothetical protein F4807DRAFT_448958 [Annulohypoxylon truncatum]